MLQLLAPHNQTVCSEIASHHPTLGQTVLGSVHREQTVVHIQGDSTSNLHMHTPPQICISMHCMQAHTCNFLCVVIKCFIFCEIYISHYTCVMRNSTALPKTILCVHIPANTKKYTIMKSGMCPIMKQHCCDLQGNRTLERGPNTVRHALCITITPSGQAECLG